MGLLDELKIELQAAADVIKPQIEGLKDFGRLNLHENTKATVAEAQTEFERRLSLLEAALAALDNLAADKYPEVAQRQVVKEIFSDLAENVSTIEAAFAKFTSVSEAVEAVITAGEPRNKP